MARSYTVLVHFERDDGSISYSQQTGSELKTVTAESIDDLEQKMEPILADMDADSYDVM